MDIQSAKEKVKEQVSLIDIVSRYVRLERAGARMKGLSPFTSEKTASFFVDPDKNLFYCFSSNQGGDVFTFLRLVEGMEFMDALKFLAEELSIDITETDSKEGRIRKELLDLCKTAVSEYRRQLTDDIVAYIKGRGVDDNSMEKWGIGYAPQGWSHMNEHLLRKGYKQDLIIQTGLVSVGKNEKVYDRFRDRIIFPLWHRKNSGSERECVGFAGRVSPTNTDDGKYINCPETPLYRKKYYCYGLDEAAQAMRKYDSAILTEGYLDVILMHQIGFTMTVAACGTAVTQEHMTAIGRHTKNIVIALDGDSAGLVSAKKAAQQAFAVGLEVRVALCPEGEDPADVAARSIDEMKSIIKNATPVIEFFIANEKKGGGKEHIYTTLFPFVSAMKDPLQKEMAFNTMSELLNISKDSLKEAFDSQSTGVTSFTPVEARARKEQKLDSKIARCARIFDAYKFLVEGEEDMTEYDEVFKMVEQEIPDRHVYTGDIRFEQEFPDELTRVSDVRALLSDSAREYMKVRYEQRIVEIAKKLDDTSIAGDERDMLEKEQGELNSKLADLDRERRY